MKNLFKLLIAAILLLPFGYEKKEDGFSLRGVLYDVDVKEQDGKKSYTIELFGMLTKQLSTIKSLFAKD